MNRSCPAMFHFVCRSNWYDNEKKTESYLNCYRENLCSIPKVYGKTIFFCWITGVEKTLDIVFDPAVSSSMTYKANIEFFEKSIIFCSVYRFLRLN